MKEYPKSKLNRVKRGANRATYDVDKINEILDAGFIGFVSYEYDGRAISIPMAYGRLNNKIYLHGSQGNRMLLSLLKVKEMSMTVMLLDGLVLARSGLHHSVNYRSVTLFGKAEKIEDPSQKEVALKCFMDHMMPGQWEHVRPMHREELDRTMVVEMIIETASAKVRDVGVNDEPEDYELPIWAGIVPLKQVAEYPVADDVLPKSIEVPPHILAYYEENKYK